MSCFELFFEQNSSKSSPDMQIRLYGERDLNDFPVSDGFRVYRAVRNLVEEEV